MLNNVYKEKANFISFFQNAFTTQEQNFRALLIATLLAAHYNDHVYGS